MSHQDPNPLTKYPRPPYPEHDQPAPGSDAAMAVQADHGEKSYKGSGKLQDKAVLITGGDSGIGRAVALAYAREGADVLISYLDEHEDARETARLVEEAGRKAVLVAGDIGTEEHCRELVRRTQAEFGRLDVLVNNAAYQKSRDDIADITAQEIQHTYATNIFAMFYLVKAALPGMKPGASIINTCSVQAYQPTPELLTYASTKGAIVTFTKGLAKMVAKKGIRVNVVAPGPIWTPLIPSTLGAEEAKKFGGQTPLGRAGQPAELAGVYVLLASEEASYITGMVYGVTGGMLTA